MSNFQNNIFENYLNTKFHLEDDSWFFLKTLLIVSYMIQILLNFIAVVLKWIIFCPVIVFGLFSGVCHLFVLPFIHHGFTYIYVYKLEAKGDVLLSGCWFLLSPDPDPIEYIFSVSCRLFNHVLNTSSVRIFHTGSRETLSTSSF